MPSVIARPSSCALYLRARERGKPAARGPLTRALLTLEGAAWQPTAPKRRPQSKTMNPLPWSPEDPSRAVSYRALTKALDEAWLAALGAPRAKGMGWHVRGDSSTAGPVVQHPFLLEALLTTSIRAVRKDYGLARSPTSRSRPSSRGPPEHDPGGALSHPRSTHRPAASRSSGGSRRRVRGDVELDHGPREG